MKTLDLMMHKSEMFAAPQVASKLMRLLKASPCNNEVISVVHYDPALTARILQVCNSVAYRGRTAISSLDDAVNRLGYENILRIVWQLSVGKKMLGSLPVYGMELGALWRHSVTTAITAEELWKATDRVQEDASTAFTAGLLHDFGKVLLNQAALTPVDCFYATTKPLLVSLEAEKEMFGVNHAEVGAELLQYWGQASALVEAVAGHHSSDFHDSIPLACLVHVANFCTHAMRPNGSHNLEPSASTMTALDTLKLKSEDLEETQAAVLKRVNEIEIFMSIV